MTLDARLNLKPEIVSVVKNILLSIDPNAKIKENKKSNLDIAIEQIENGECERFKDFESYQKAMRDKETLIQKQLQEFKSMKKVKLDKIPTQDEIDRERIARYEA